jgi:hypothetical protein
VKATKSGTIQFIEPIYALAVQNIPEGKEWLYEVKFDALVQRERIALAESPPMGFFPTNAGKQTLAVFLDLILLVD